MSPSHLQITCADGFPLVATLLRPTTENGALVVISSALGVPRRYYAPFAAYLVERGFTVVTFDYRGIGDSQQAFTSGKQLRMADWGRLDLQAVLVWASADLKPTKLFLIGHSCGGQLAGLAEQSAQLAGMVFVAVQSGYWRHWAWPARLGMGLLWYGLIPALTWYGDVFPARALGISSVNVPSGVARQWASWGRVPGYLLDPSQALATAGYAKLCLPILAYSFSDDAYAPQCAVAAMLAAYPQADIAWRQVQPGAVKQAAIGHFGFFRPELRATLWRETADWLQALC